MDTQTSKLHSACTIWYLVSLGKIVMFLGTQCPSTFLLQVILSICQRKMCYQGDLYKCLAQELLSCLLQFARLVNTFLLVCRLWIYFLLLNLLGKVPEATCFIHLCCFAERFLSHLSVDKVYSVWDKLDVAKQLYTLPLVLECGQKQVWLLQIN